LSVLNLAAGCSAADTNGGTATLHGTGGGGGSGGSGSGSARSGNGSGGGVGGPGGGLGSGGSHGGAGGAASNGGGGGYNIPPAATMDAGLANLILLGSEFIFDIQTHHIEHEGDWRNTNPQQGKQMGDYFAQSNGCTKADTTLCIDAETYLHKMFLESDTTMAVLSGFPAPLCADGNRTSCGNPLDNDAMALSAQRFNMIAHSQRVVNHCQVNPTDHTDLQLAIMENITQKYGVWGYKTYPEWGPTGKGWFMDGPEGIKMIEKARSLGVKVICMHKGIVFPGWDRAASHPRDVGVVAKRYPDTKFIVYHSAIELGPTSAQEGPYNPNNTAGTDRLIRAVEDNGLKGQNLYAELGSVWAQVMNSPTMAAHVIGKLLKYVGEDNVLWGSECVWLGSPQPQIEAFRRFQISQQFQDQYGYPALTPAIKAKIFGLSAAKVYNVDPKALRYKMTKTTLAQLKDQADAELGGRRWAFQEMGGPRTRREFLNLARLTGGRPG
jgi:predicted TIM-barrel fold metal-dependent hydrolase